MLERYRFFRLKVGILLEVFPVSGQNRRCFFENERSVEKNSVKVEIWGFGGRTGAGPRRFCRFLSSKVDRTGAGPPSETPNFSFQCVPLDEMLIFEKTSTILASYGENLE